MLRINTFGGLTLRQGDAPLTGAPTQRRRMALLALLAVAGDKGVARDKLLALLWPEGETEKSRHALNQILSAQRRHFGDAQLFDGRKTVRLNRDLISSDLDLFEKALASGDLDTAVELYSGPFLDGFFVPDSPEFETWASDHRSRLANRLADALDRAAVAAHAAGSHNEAVKWRRHEVELDRLDSARTLRYAHSLVLSGNRAGAIRALRECPSRISDELGVAGDPQLANRIAELTSELGG